ncbi:MAG TPA: phosphate acyltransferase PlsX, partial [bacterium]|nr:phosphate acyltransferase PlsX [bacterium]
LILDVGATVRCTSEQLLQFAYMGHAYASRISKVPSPAIGLLNMGEEETKGDEVLTNAYKLLKEDPQLNFIGNVEGNDLPRGVADVIVTEGFTGNVVLKFAEGVSEVAKNLGDYAFKRKMLWRLGLIFLSSGLRQIKDLTDYREYGGAPFLGFTRIVIKAHGRSGAMAISNAIKVAAKAVRDGVPEEIRRSVQGFERRTAG